MQYPEFGTQVGRLKSLWLTLLGMTGLGQGAAPSLPIAVTLYESGIGCAATSMSSTVTSMRSAIRGEGLHSRRSGVSSAARGACLACSGQRRRPSYVSLSMQMVEALLRFRL